MGSLLLLCAAYWVVPGRGGEPQRCNCSGVAVDACRDTTACVRRAAHAADGGVVDVPQALHGSSSAPPIHAQRGARCDGHGTRNCFIQNKSSCKFFGDHVHLRGGLLGEPQLFPLLVEFHHF
jgi:hypothetical protein